MGRKAIYPYDIEVGEHRDFASDKPLASIKAAVNAYGKKHGRAYLVAQWHDVDTHAPLPHYTLERTA